MTNIPIKLSTTNSSITRHVFFSTKFCSPRCIFRSGQDFANFLFCLFPIAHLFAWNSFLESLDASNTFPKFPNKKNVKTIISTVTNIPMPTIMVYSAAFPFRTRSTHKYVIAICSITTPTAPGINTFLEYKFRNSCSITCSCRNNKQFCRVWWFVIFSIFEILSNK